jgi:hypothetical protein
VGDSFNLYLHRRLGKRRNLHQRARGEIAREHLAARLPDFFALRDLGDEVLACVRYIGPRFVSSGLQGISKSDS